MPRNCSPTERALIAGAGVNHLLYLFVEDADGVMQDCSSLGDLELDFLDGSSWSETLDTPVSTGTIALRRDTTDDTAAPTMGSSSINRTALGAYAPLFEKGRAVLIKTATVAQGANPLEADKKPMFTGRIDTVHWQDNPMTIEISDLGAWLADAQLREPKQYASDSTVLGAGPLLGAVIQAMLDDAIATGSISLYEPVTAPFQPFSSALQEPGSALAAMRAWAQEIGWELRYQWDSADVFRFTLFEPPRDKVVADWTIGPTEYRKITNLTSSLVDIRNEIIVQYKDESGAIQSVSAIDGTSVTKYGGPNRVSRLWQFSSAAIRRAEDAQALADAVLSDLKEAPVDQEVELPYFWPVQIGDLISFLANDDHYDSNQILAVVAFTHAFQNGEGSTTIQCRGSVAGAYRAWLRRGSLLGEEPQEGDESRSLNKFTWTDSLDGKLRTFKMEAGANITAVDIYDTRIVEPPSADPWPTDASKPKLTRRPELSTRLITYTAEKPPNGSKEYVKFRPRMMFRSGISRFAVIDPAPAALDPRLRATRTGVTGNVVDLVAIINAGISDWPVTAEIAVDDPDNAPILSIMLNSNTTLTKANYSQLGGLLLPLRELRHFWLTITNVAGERKQAHASADRDPLPNGATSTREYKEKPELITDTDDDSDELEILTPIGIKTYTPPEVETIYTVAEDELDNTLIETPLKLDETRDGYAVTLTGGGERRTIFKGALHGRPSKPPTVSVRRVFSANRDTVDLFVVVATHTVERLRLFFRDSDGAGASIYGLCVGAGDATPLYVTNGTEIGPSYFFVAGGSPAAKLAAIPVLRDQIKPVHVMVKGEDSLVESAWFPIALSMKEQPWLESFEITWDNAAGVIRWDLRGGANCASAGLEFSESPTFSAPITASTALADGGSASGTIALSAGQRGRPWYGRATPFNAALLGGLPGAPQVASCDVLAIITVSAAATENTSAGTGTLTVTISDPGLVIDQVNKLKFYKTINGVRSLVAPTSGPVATTGDFVLTLNLDPKHNIKIEPIIYFVDTMSEIIGAWTFDSDKNANILNATVATHDNVATVTAVCDTDTKVDVNCFRYRIDGGAYTALTVPSSLVVQFNVTMSPTAKQTIEMSALDVDGNWGPTTTIEIPAYNKASLILSVTPLAPTATGRYAFRVTVNDSISQGAGSLHLTYAISGGVSVYLYNTSTGWDLPADFDPNTTHDYEALHTDTDNAKTIYLELSAANRISTGVTITIPPAVLVPGEPTLGISSAQTQSGNVVRIAWTNSGFPSGTTFNVTYEFSTSGNDLGTLIDQTSPVDITLGSAPTGSRYKITIEAVKDGKTLVSRNRNGITIL